MGMCWHCIKNILSDFRCMIVFLQTHNSEKLGWSHQITVRELVREMVEADLVTMRSAPIGRGS